jgi:membrane protein insertase Oxa1/YidC/SpoIIIJ
MIPIMQAFAKATHSYGWAIILLTLLIRLLVWPLVASSTKSMQRMSQLQPKLKALQEKYKDDPQLFQQKAMEFYSKNKINPLGGCLPTLVQLPVLIALFATFTGPPFQDKPIPVKVNLAKPEDVASVKIVSNPTSGANSPYVSADGKLAKFAVQPGDQTRVWGYENGVKTDQPTAIDFHTVAVAGDPPPGFKPGWKIEHDPNGATIDTVTGQAAFPAAGDVTVQAALPDGQFIEVPIKVEPGQAQQGGFNLFGGPSADPFRTKTPQSADQKTISVGGQQVTVAVSPGPSSVVAGSKGVQFQLTPVNGGELKDVHAVWHIVKDTNAATIDADGHAVFRRPGEITVAAVIPAEAKNEPFYFVSSLGKVARGAELLMPKNWDVLGMLIAFSITMYLSQMLMVQPSTSMDPEQAAIQKQTQQTMPIAVTAMFFFFALPAGVYLYLVVSNVMQTLQTWLIYKTTKTTLDDDESPQPDDGGGNVIDISGKISDDGGAGAKISTSETKKNAKKKK